MLYAELCEIQLFLRQVVFLKEEAGSHITINGTFLAAFCKNASKNSVFKKKRGGGGIMGSI